MGNLFTNKSKHHLLPSSTVLQQLLAVCPSFQPIWDEYRKTNHSDTEKDLPFIDMAEFVHHLVDLQLKGLTTEFSAIFTTVENLLSNGDQQTKELIVVGLLEGIQNAAGWQENLNPEDFTPYLGKNSHIAWQELNQDWQATN